MIVLTSAGAGAACSEPEALIRHDSFHLHDWHAETDAHTENTGSFDTGKPFDQDPVAHGAVVAVACRRPSAVQRHQFALNSALEPEKYNPGVTPLP